MSRLTWTARVVGWGRMVVVVPILIAAVSVRAYASPCAGDCNVNATVAINELVTCVNIALETAAHGTCTSCDQNDDGQVKVNELIAAVNFALGSCDQPFAEASSGVADGVREVGTDTIEIIDFGYVGNVGSAATTAGAGPGAVDFDTCFCPGGGTLQGVSCTATDNASEFSATLVDCVAGDTTRDGTLTLHVNDPNFCTTCVIPVSVAAQQVYADGFTSSVEQVGAFTVVDELTESFRLSAAGSCLPPGSLLANNRDSTFSGKMRVGPAAGPHALIDFLAYRTQVATTLDDRGFCRITSIQDGTFRVDDQINQRIFTQTAHNLVTTDTLLADGPAREVTLNTPDGGSLDVDCLGGPTQLITDPDDPLVYPSLGACATSGSLETRLLNGSVRTCIRYSPAGVALDFECDGGDPDATFASCRELKQCSVPVLLESATPSPTPTLTPPVSGGTPTRTPTVGGNPEPVWTQDFEADTSEWSVEGGVWQIGEPTAANGPSAHGGTNCVGTILAGDYPNNANALLVSPEFIVPPADQAPRFRYWYWYNTYNSADYGQLQLRVDGDDWVDLPERVAQTGGSWAQRLVDLREYAGHVVQVGFLFHSDGSAVSTGWYIDDVALETGPMALRHPEEFESGLGDWSVENGVWQIGEPTAANGPSAHGGTNCVGTILAGDYPNNANALLVSPEFIVPPADQAPRFRYWYWYNTYNSADYGQLQLRMDGDDWVDLPERVAQTGGSWAQRLVDLREYAGHVVQVGFFFHSDGSAVSTGWYIDDVALETAPLVLRHPEDFESGLGDWSVENGVWQIGEPTAANGPSAHGGTNCVGTILAGDYPNNANALLVSPEFIVPPADQAPRFRYWYWYNTYNSADYGQLQLRVDGDDWVDLPERVAQTGGSWAQRLVDLREYAGHVVQVGFFFHSDGSAVSTGWYIDDVALETAPLVLRHPEDFESGLGDWSVENGVWQIGEPTAANGPSAHGGTNCVGTILAGDYPNNANALLVSPEFIVPPADQAPRFRYWYWYNTYNSADYGQLQIRVDGGDWVDLPERVTGPGGSWAQRSVDLREYAGHVVQVGFLFHSDGSAVSTGWYIDDVALETAPMALRIAHSAHEERG